MPLEIAGKTILITGANRGIGRAIVDEAINRGANKVYAAVRTPGAADALVAEHGDRIVPIHIDLEDPASITAAAKLASDVDVVVNNAGVLKTTNAIDPDAIESLKYEMNINVYGLIRMAQAFAPVLKANGGGALAQLNSVASLRTFDGFSTYAASKAASYSITQALRQQLAEQGTQVVSVHPGPIATDMGSDAGFEEVAEPPALVAKALFEAIAEDKFHVWPDSVAKQVAEAYQAFADKVIESDRQESPA